MQQKPTMIFVAFSFAFLLSKMKSYTNPLFFAKYLDELTKHLFLLFVASEKKQTYFKRSNSFWYSGLSNNGVNTGCNSSCDKVDNTI